MCCAKFLALILNPSKPAIADLEEEDADKLARKTITRFVWIKMVLRFGPIGAFRAFGGTAPRRSV
jgi:hypothetical protein